MSLRAAGKHDARLLRLPNGLIVAYVPGWLIYPNPQVVPISRTPQARRLPGHLYEIGLTFYAARWSLALLVAANIVYVWLVLNK